MRRKDREQSEEFGWDVLETCPYAVLSTTGEAGLPYSIPVSPAVLDGARVYAVYDHFVELWNDELHIVDEYQRRETDYQSRRVAQIIPVDVFSEQQLKHLLCLKNFPEA